MTKIKHVLLYSLFFISSTAFASTSLRNIEISVAAGPNWSHADNTSLVVSPYETDSIRVNHVSNSALWKIGAGYHFFAEQLAQKEFFNDLLLELNVYHSAETVKGNVWQYQLPQFNNYSFNAPYNSTRLMLDFKPGLYTWDHISLYPILGIGAAWNEVSYHENVTVAGVAANSFQSLANHTNASFAYDLGAGVNLNMNSNIVASLEYLYAHAGKMFPSGRATNGVALTAPPAFKIHSQSILLGLSWKFC